MLLTRRQELNIPNSRAGALLAPPEQRAEGASPAESPAGAGEGLHEVTPEQGMAEKSSLFLGPGSPHPSLSPNDWGLGGHERDDPELPSPKLLCCLTQDDTILARAWITGFLFGSFRTVFPAFWFLHAFIQ